jgi:hypothetical protein
VTDEEVPEIYNKIYAASKNWYLLTGKKGKFIGLPAFPLMRKKTWDLQKTVLSFFIQNTLFLFMTYSG